MLRKVVCIFLCMHLSLSSFLILFPKTCRYAPCMVDLKMRAYHVNHLILISESLPRCLPYLRASLSFSLKVLISSFMVFIL